MSLETYFSGHGSQGYLTDLANCLTSVGTERFNARYLGLIERVVKADQCSIFSFRDRRPNCFLSYNKIEGHGAANAPQRYLSNGYRDDPLLTQDWEIPADTGLRIVDFSEVRPLMSEGYFDSYFHSCGIADKISVIASSGGDTLFLSFYRSQDTGPFAISETGLRVPFWQILSKLALLHFFGIGAKQLQSPLNSLSEREKDICEAMLEGLTTDAIAWRLEISASTVKTYRQRAYRKLGINSKSALFELCRPG